MLLFDDHVIVLIITVAGVSASSLDLLGLGSSCEAHEHAGPRLSMLLTLAASTLEIDRFGNRHIRREQG